MAAQPRNGSRLQSKHKTTACSFMANQSWGTTAWLALIFWRQAFIYLPFQWCELIPWFYYRELKGVCCSNWWCHHWPPMLCCPQLSPSIRIQLASILHSTSRTGSSMCCYWLFSTSTTFTQDMQTPWSWEGQEISQWPWTSTLPASGTPSPCSYSPPQWCIGCRHSGCQQSCGWRGCRWGIWCCTRWMGAPCWRPDKSPKSPCSVWMPTNSQWTTYHCTLWHDYSLWNFLQSRSHYYCHCKFGTCDIYHSSASY